MTRTSISLVFALACALWSLAGYADETGAGDDWRVEPISWSRALAPARAVQVVNRYGEVRLRGFGDRRVELTGLVQRHPDDPRRAEILAHRDGEILRIEVTYRGEDRTRDPPDEWRKRRTDITVYVAETAPVRLETLHGLGQAKGLRADVEASSESGDLEIATEGTVRATSRYGALRVQLLGDAPWPQPPQLSSLTGPIRLSLPWARAFEAEIETRGEITSDYSTEIDWPPGTLLKRAHVRASASGGEPPPALRLTSNRGAISLLRMPQLETPAAAGGDDDRRADDG